MVDANRVVIFMLLLIVGIMIILGFFSVVALKAFIFAFSCLMLFMVSRIIKFDDRQYVHHMNTVKTYRKFLRKKYGI